MCTEFLLAIIYFITILTINYFLFRLLKNYLLNISYLIRIKNIFSLYAFNMNKIISALYSIEKNKLFNNKTLFCFKKIIDTETLNKKDDLLIIGKIYTKLFKLSNNNYLVNKENFLFFNLLKKHYLSDKF